MQNKIHSFTLTKDGEQVTFSKEPAAVVATLRNGRYTVTITREKSKRSLKQNALMWLWFNCIAEQTTTPVNIVHDYYCTQFLHHPIEWNGRSAPIVEGTKHLSEERMHDFLEKVKADALTDLGIQLPLPEDRFFEQFYQTYK